MTAIEKLESTAIRSFCPSIPDADLADLRRRLGATRLPGHETVPDQSQGVQLATLHRLARYWASDYDWRAFEKRFAALPQFITEIDGVDIHFVHVRSKYDGAMPLVLCHGWPGSVVELLKLVDPLVDPLAYGFGATDAFHVVIPSMPGYGFSGTPATTGWGPSRIARAWVTLMKRLGYAQFVAQGGDWGALVVDEMAVQTPTELLAIHTNMPGVVPPEIERAAVQGEHPPPRLTADERRAYEQLVFTYQHIANTAIMASRPQTLAALADSPVGLAAFVIDHDPRSYELVARAFDGCAEPLTRDDILDNISLYWFTNTAVSAARLYWENRLGFFDPKHVAIPAAVSAFPDELFQAPRSWCERAYPKLIYYNRPDRGGHFAAWEQPELFAHELRVAFRPLRPFRPR